MRKWKHHKQNTWTPNWGYTPPPPPPPQKKHKYNNSLIFVCRNLQLSLIFAIGLWQDGLDFNVYHPRNRNISFKYFQIFFSKVQNLKFIHEKEKLKRKEKRKQLLKLGRNHPLVIDNLHFEETTTKFAYSYQLAIYS